MKLNRFYFLFLFSVLQLFSCNEKQLDITDFKANVLKSTTLSVDQKVSLLLDQMTLEEKIGQMNQYSGFWDFHGSSS